MSENKTSRLSIIVPVITALIAAITTIAVAYINRTPEKSTIPITNQKQGKEPGEPAPCPAWYEGDDCQTEMRQKFYGRYKGIAKETKGQQFEATLILSEGHDKDVRSINVFWGIGSDNKPLEWNVVLTGANSVKIPLQHISNSPVAELKGITYSDEGDGKLSGNTLTFDWIAIFPWDSYYWSMTLAKL